LSDQEGQYHLQRWGRSTLVVVPNSVILSQKAVTSRVHIPFTSLQMHRCLDQFGPNFFDFLLTNKAIAALWQEGGVEYQAYV